MKKLLLASVLLMSLVGFSQKEKKVDKGYQYLYKELSFETDDYKIYIVDAKAVAPWAKFKIRVFNKTNDYLVFKPQEMFYSAGDFNVAGTDKDLIIAPNEEASKTIDFKGNAMQVEKFNIEIKGIYKVAGNAPVSTAADFTLPPSKNDFQAGGFTCKLLDSKQTTDKTTAKFGCTYDGNGIGILDPYKCAAVMPNGQDNANTKKYNGVLLEKGKYEDFFVHFNEVAGAGDMQKSTFKIKWNDTFRESKLVPLKAITLEMLLDPDKTKEKNK